MLSQPIFRNSAPEPTAHAHVIKNMRAAAVKYWISYQFDTIVRWGIDMFPSVAVKDGQAKAGAMFMELYFDNILAVSIALGNLTHCTNERGTSPVQLSI